MILKRFAGLFLPPFALLAGAPLAAKDARPGLFMRNGEAFIFRIESGQPVDVRVAGKDDKPAEGEFKAELVDQGGSTLTLTNQTAEQVNYEAWKVRN